LREQVFGRDRGVCALCGLDTVEFSRRLKLFPLKKRQELRARLGMPRSRQSFWDADHIVPVAEGGGECDLSNLRTLCLWCHENETARLRARLALAQVKLKQDPRYRRAMPGRRENAPIS
jgi:5-methylcytosine-specific restriction endonuclease McrA